MGVLAAEEMMRFGLQPKAALLSHSNYGSSNQPSAVKMREVLESQPNLKIKQAEVTDVVVESLVDGRWPTAAEID